MTEDGLPKPRRYQAIAALCFGTALTVIDGSIASVALPTIASDLGTSSSTIVSVVTIYQLVLVMTLLPFSNLGDRLGHRRLYQYGQIVFTIATALCFFVNSLPFLLIVRAIQGLGAAATLSMMSALLRATYPANQLGRALAINTAIATCASTLAPTLGGIILGVASWPWVFAVAAPFGLLSLFLGRALPDPNPVDQPFDVLGAALCAATFGLIIGGAELTVHGDSPVVAGTLVFAGIYVGYLFVRRELGEPRPILPLDLLGRPALALSIASGFAAFNAMMVFALSLPFRLQHDYGLRPEEVGAVLAVFPATMMFVAPLSGVLSDRTRPGLLEITGMTIAVTALLLFAWWPAEPGYVHIAWRLALIALGFGLFMAPNARLLIKSAPMERAAAAGGLLSTARYVGQASGATLAATLLAAGGGNALPVAAAALAFLAGFFALVRMRAR